MKNIIQRALYQIMEIYPKANIVKGEFKDGFFQCSIYDSDKEQEVNVRAEIVDLKLYVSFKEVEKV
jgi:hypothetical protein